MSARIISGTEIAKTVRQDVARRAARLARDHGVVPGLATVLVGDDPASRLYVGMKNRAAAAAGIHSEQVTLSASIGQAELLSKIEDLNHNPAIHGILVQLPLPRGIDSAQILEAVAPEKDVDGFHPINAGRLWAGDPEVLAPCTPKGIVELLLRSGCDPSGKHVVVVGRSNIVGKPMASLLLGKGRGGNATVTVAHSRTADLGALARQAEILIVAAGRPGLVNGGMIRPGSVVVDVGTNRVDDPQASKGYRIVGDVDFEEACKTAGAVTPVPGGVGPMTIAMLLSNTVQAARAGAGE